MLLVDVHAHLDYEPFDKDLEEVLNRAKKSGVKAIINNSTHLESIKKTLLLSKKYPIIKPALGIHPTNLNDEKQIKASLNLIKTEKAVALGEIGLDYHYSKDNIEKQKEIFRELLKIAEERNLPVIIHSREATKDTFDILKEYPKLKVIMHCFQGRKSEIKEGIKRNYFFTIPSSINRNDTFRYMAEAIPLNRLLTETDSPYQSPNKEERNEPSNIIIAISAIAKIKGVTEEETANAIFQNYQNLF